MIYKIRVILDTQDDIFRDIEIKDLQTLWNLHSAVKSAFSLQGDELSTFNLLESDGTILKSVPLEDMSDDGDGEIMSDVYIKEVFEEKGDKAQFQYGLFDLWEFFCELIEVYEEKPSVKYPITVYRFGKVPLKAPTKTPTTSKSKKSNAVVMEDDFLFNDHFDADAFLEEEEEDDYDDYNDDVFDEDED